MFNKATQINAFYLDKTGEYYGDVTTYILSAKNLYYLLGILNSKMFYFAHNAFYVGGGIDGEITLFTLEKFPIPKIDPKNKKLADKITACVNKILESKSQGNDTNDLENQIDDLVFELYDLDSTDIKTINGEWLYYNACGILQVYFL